MHRLMAVNLTKWRKMLGWAVEKSICRCFQFVQSSIGKKVMVALAGLLLCGFLITHLAGNLFLFAGADAFNHYAEVLEKSPLLLPAEFGLVALFLVHIALSLRARWENKQARPVDYALREGKGARTPGSRTMAYSGLLLLAFLVVHIKTFKFGDQSDGLFALVMSSFGNKAYTGFYVLAMAAVGLHLSHGFQSAFQTLGVNHPKYTPLIKGAGLLFALAIAGGFAVLPIWACFFFGGVK
jgi:succinate dehydrogenase / fumarate reductase cytochrome b subunit